MKIKKTAILTLVLFLSIIVFGQNAEILLIDHSAIKNGAERLDKYLKLLENKNVAVVANQSSLVGNIHLVDTLLSRDINITNIFCPEHGFRGDTEAGKIIDNKIDIKTKIPIISLYGSHKKPLSSDLDNIDIVLFDLQDVGARFYTYISTLTYVMEACAEHGIPIIILDRPNPNGYMVDGPMLQEEYKSFVGLHPVPVVYGMTIGEYGRMVVGEQWINNAKQIDLKVIPVEGYNHNMIVKLKTKPSPNLPNWQSIYLYPSLCFFEGTIMSIGRGTEFPFMVYGHPKFMIGSFIFTPDSTQSASNPKFKGISCYGSNLKGYAENYKNNSPFLNLDWLIASFSLIGSFDVLQNNCEFFSNYFDKLAGTDTLRKQIIAGLSEEEIRKSWQPGIEKFKKIRSKYLLYP